MTEMRVDWVGVSRDGVDVEVSFTLTPVTGHGLPDRVRPDEIPPDVLRELRRWLDRVGRP